MRKALIAVIAAAVLFAVGAFAASFAVDSEDIASGSNAVEPCTTDVVVDFTQGTYDNTADEWPVDTATLDFGEGGTDCIGGQATLVLENEAGTVIYEASLAIAATTVDFDLTGEAIDVGDVWNAAVLVDELFIPTTTA